MLKGATIHFLSIWSRILFKHLYALLDPRPWTKGSYELGSVRLSILPSENFLGIGSLVFSETHHGVRDPCGVRNRAAFFEKKNLTPKWGKWSKFCPDNGFLNFLENLVIFFFLNLVYNESLFYLLQNVLGKSDRKISTTNWCKSLIFCMLIQTHRN